MERQGRERERERERDREREMHKNFKCSSNIGVVGLR